MGDFIFVVHVSRWSIYKKKKTNKVMIKFEHLLKYGKETSIIKESVKRWHSI